jgi:molybdopterin converting factor small subunit
MMEVTVYYFAYLKEERNIEIEIISINKSISVAELFFSIFNRPPLSIRYAINEQFVSSDKLIQHQDEIAFIPPLGGG